VVTIPLPLSRLLVTFGLMKNPVDRPLDDRLLEAYYDRLLVFAAGKSRVVAVEFSSRDPELAANMANTIVSLYLEMEEAAKKDSARSASEFYAKVINPLRQRVQEAERKVEDFRRDKGLPRGANGSLLDQQLAELSAQLASARSARADAEAKAKTLRDALKGNRVLDIPDVSNNELVRRLKEQSVTLRSQQALESRTLLAEHPRIKELNAQIADLDRLINDEAKRIVRTLENDAKIAGDRVDGVLNETETLRKLVAKANELEPELKSLERDAKVLRDQLESFQGKYREAAARDAENALPADARIVSRAFAPTTPSFPKKMPIVLLATLAALVSSCAFVVTRELLSGRGIAAPFGAAPYSATPSVAAPAAIGDAAVNSFAGRRFADAMADPAPRSGAEPTSVDLATLDLAGDGPPGDAAIIPVGAGMSLTSAYGKLASELPPARADGRGRRILVTEAVHGHGVLATARGLARYLARNERVILVFLVDDAISPNRLGLTDLVSAKASFAEIIDRETGSRLHVMAPGTSDPGVLKDVPDMVELGLAALDQTYDWVFLMVPGERRQEFTPLLAPRVEGAIVVARLEDQEQGTAAEVCEMLQAEGARQVVIALACAQDLNAAA
jgi:tyrosine-protein kinase Etk/Wzc